MQGSGGSGSARTPEKVEATGIRNLNRKNPHPCRDGDQNSVGMPGYTIVSAPR